jgi:hypothetical protein
MKLSELRNGRTYTCTIKATGEAEDLVFYRGTDDVWAEFVRQDGTPVMVEDVTVVREVTK